MALLMQVSCVFEAENVPKSHLLVTEFHEQPLALIKNRIANAQCVECVDGPDGPDDPVDPDTCAGNQIIVELQLDNYATETSWRVLDADGMVVGASEAFGKLDMNTYHADTLCLPNGCYSFEIDDEDGLAGFGCGEGMYIVNGPEGELASGQNFAGKEYYASNKQQKVRTAMTGTDNLIIDTD